MGGVRRVAQSGEGLLAGGAHPGRRAQARPVGRGLGGIHQGPADTAAAMVRVDGAKDLGAVEVLVRIDVEPGPAGHGMIGAGDPH